MLRRITLFIFAIGFFIAIRSTTQAICDPSHLSILPSDNVPGGSGGNAISADGRYIAFGTTSKLDPADNDTYGDAYVYDRILCTTELVSVATDGTHTNIGSGATDISADGRYVLFKTDSNFAGAPSQPGEILLRDRQNGTTTRFTTKYPTYAKFSPNGRFIVFLRISVDLVDRTNIYVYDFQTGQTTAVPFVAPSVFPQPASQVSISNDGRYISFVSADGSLAGSTNPIVSNNVFVRDRQAATTILMSAAPPTVSGNRARGGGNPSMSADGRLIAFTSGGSDLVSGDDNNQTDMFIKDWQNNQTTRISLTPIGELPSTQLGTGVWGARMTPDGRFLIIQLLETVVVPGNVVNRLTDYIWDNITQQLVMVSVNEAGERANKDSELGNLSLDNQVFIYSSDASNLVSGDSNNKSDVFVAPLSRLYSAFIVTTTDDLNDGVCDDSHCSLREAILAANNSETVTPVIGFRIPGNGPYTIRPTTPLPGLIHSIVIAGHSQPGFSGSPVIELDGSLAGSEANGLVLNGGKSIVRGLAINRFGGNGIQINNLGDNTIIGNYIGTTVAGTAAIGSMHSGIEVNNAPDNTIGGKTRPTRNVISGNENGITLTGINTTTNIIVGNYIGTNVNGTAALGNLLNGIKIDGAPGNLIEDMTDQAPNVISGNGNGILITGASAENNLIRGNYIGTNATGSAALGNSLDGIRIENVAKTSIEGGGYPNVISANENGIHIIGAQATGNLIRDNYIGTNASGTAALGNSKFGVWLENADDNIIGNVLSYCCRRNVISGNNPGLNATGGGIGISGDGNIIQANKIGTDMNGLLSLGNGTSGVLLDDATNTDIVGSYYTGGNTIAFNNGAGILIRGSQAINNSIQGNNSIFGNTGLGIDLAPTGLADGITSNDNHDVDSGPNNLQNFPVLTAALYFLSPWNGVEIHGVLNSTPNQRIYLEFFVSDMCHASGNGDGQSRIGSIYLDIPTSGTQTFKNDIYGAVSAGKFITATATDANGNTSEFSNCTTVVVPQAGPTFTVTNTGDRNMWCTVSSCSLREAILAANDKTDSNTIRFNIAGSAPYTIKPSSPLPSIMSPTTMDGTTQPGYAGKPIIELSGSLAGANADGLVLYTSGSIVKALVINNFSAHGIRFQGSMGQVIRSYIGTDHTGTSPLPNGSGGTNEGGIISESYSTIGGAAVNDGNVISGNNPNGIVMLNGGIAKGNVIGLNATQNAALPNLVGIRVVGNGATIGGVQLSDGNVISGNLTTGILIQGNQNQIWGNFVGTTQAGAPALGNKLTGIEIEGSYNVVGGWEPGQKNLIAFNGGAGIAVGDGTASPGHNLIAGNLIFSNAELGIDLFPLGPTANDADDSDVGANNLQNYPHLTSVIDSSNQTIFNGELNGVANRAYKIDFFANQRCDASGYGEGQYLIGSTNIQLNDQGYSNFNASFNFQPSQNRFITAIATDMLSLDSSEFSQCYRVPIESASGAAPVLSFYSNFDVTLSWTAISWSQGYRVQIANSEIFDANWIIHEALLDSNQLTFDYNAPREGSFYWRVGSVTVDGTVVWSPVQTFVIYIP